MDKNRQRITGMLTAPDRASALRILSTNYPVITALESGRVGWLQRLGVKTNVTHEELVTFTQTLATLLQAGLTLKAALELLGREMQGPAINAVIVQLSHDLGEGEMISEAMARHPQVFSKLYRSLVLSGETGGRLPEVLAKLGDFLARAESMRDRLRVATVYPSIVLTFAIVVGTLLLAYAVPQLESLYSGLNSRLPGPTQALVDVARFVGAYLPWIVLIAVALALFIRTAVRTRPGGLFLDQLKLRFGPTRDLFAYLYTARFAHTLGTLHGSGVPLLKTLEILADTLGNRVLERRIHRIVQDVKDGSSLSAALHKHRVVTDIAAGLVEAGEESGQLDPILDRMTVYYQGKFDTSLHTLAAMAEPALIIVVGLVVGMIVVLLGLPFANLVNILS